MSVRLSKELRITTAKIVQVMNSYNEYEKPTWDVCREKLQESTNWSDAKVDYNLERASKWALYILKRT